MGPGYDDYYMDDDGDVQSMSQLAQDLADAAQELADAIAQSTSPEDDE